VSQRRKTHTHTHTHTHTQSALAHVLQNQCLVREVALYPNCRHWYPPDELARDTALLYDSTWRGVVDAVVGLTACVLLVMTPWAVGFVLRAVHSTGSILHIDVLRAWVDWLMVRTTANFESSVLPASISIL
jgi:hypothetical protein